MRSFGVDEATVENVQAILSGEPTSATSTPASSCYSSSRNLTIGSEGQDVRTLQSFLNTHGANVASSGPGSPGAETTYFGALTQNAVARFQAAHAVSPAVGYFGPLTQIAISSVCASAPAAPVNTTPNNTTPVSTPAETATSSQAALPPPPPAVTGVFGGVYGGGPTPPAPDTTPP
ncbi:MAG: peptidoglycan-binding domain-containing protein, partial [Candidatus Saccharimonadales bacterium]